MTGLFRLELGFVQLLWAAFRSLRKTGKNGHNSLFCVHWPQQFLFWSDRATTRNELWLFHGTLLYHTRALRKLFCHFAILGQYNNPQRDRHIDALIHNISLPISADDGCHPGDVYRSMKA